MSEQSRSRLRRLLGPSLVVLCGLIVWGSLASRASDPITGVWVTSTKPPARAVFDPSGRYQLTGENGARREGKWRASQGQVHRLSYLDSRGGVEGWAFILLEKPADAALHAGKDKTLTPMPDFRGYVLTPDVAEAGEERFFLVEGHLWGDPAYYKRPQNAFAAWWERERQRFRFITSP